MFDTLIRPEDLYRIPSGERLVVDCRFELLNVNAGEEAYRGGHIPGSVYAHLDRDLSGKIVPGKTGRHPLPDPELLERKLRQWGLDAGMQLIAYDQGHGAFAARLWWLLNWLGHDKAAVLDGGIAAWEEAGLPVETGNPEPRPGNFRVSQRKGMTISAEELGKPDLLLIDARDPERYRGKVEPIDRVAGHIPDAINIPYKQNLDSSGRWKEPRLLKERFLQAGIEQTAARPVFYCGSGVTACHNILAYRTAGYDWPLLYAGSWSEWITDPDRPVEKD